MEDNLKRDTPITQTLQIRMQGPTRIVWRNGSVEHPAKPEVTRHTHTHASCETNPKESYIVTFRLGPPDNACCCRGGVSGADAAFGHEVFLCYAARHTAVQQKWCTLHFYPTLFLMWSGKADDWLSAQVIRPTLFFNAKAHARKQNKAPLRLIWRALIQARLDGASGKVTGPKTSLVWVGSIRLSWSARSRDPVSASAVPRLAFDSLCLAEFITVAEHESISRSSSRARLMAGDKGTQ